MNSEKLKKKIASLTPSEREHLDMLLKFYTYQEMAELTGLTVDVCKRHCRNCFFKMGITEVGPGNKRLHLMRLCSIAKIKEAANPFPADYLHPEDHMGGFNYDPKKVKPKYD